MYKILLVDDEHISRDMLATYVEGLLGFDVTQAKSGEEALNLFEAEDFSIVLSDIKMPGMNGIELLRRIKSTAKGKAARMVLFTGFAQVETAVEALREGAYDYLFKPIDVNRLSAIIKEIVIELDMEQMKSLAGELPVGSSKSHSAYSYLEIPGFDKIGIFSKSMKEIVDICRKLHNDRSIQVLVEGESGTGKEIIAALIHHGFKGASAPIVSINCAALSPSLFESEIFGYESGSFTGGNHDGKIGKLELAQGGTIVLDEIGEIPIELQPKLLRVIQERSFFRVGGTKQIKLDVRFIASTNQDLSELVKADKFRYDLYYRINSTTIKVPALRNQHEAIAPLAQMFLVEFAEKKNKNFRLIDKNAISILEHYPWKGNVRELRNTIERIVLLYDDYELRVDHLAFLESEIDSLKGGKYILRPGSFDLPEDNLNIEAIEREIVDKALTKFAGNKTQTARYLGLTPSSLRSRIR